MTDKEAAETAKKIKIDNGSDYEVSHGKLDNLLCDILSSLGYTKLVEEFHNSHKYYA